MVQQKDSKAASELAAAIKQAKSAKMHFVLVLKGAADGELLVSKTKIGATEIAAAKARSGGTKIVAGTCQVEDEHLVFESDESPSPQLEKAAKEIAKRDAGVTIKPQFRQAAAQTGGNGNGNDATKQPPASGFAKGQTPDRTAAKPGFLGAQRGAAPPGTGSATDKQPSPSGFTKAQQPTGTAAKPGMLGAQRGAAPQKDPPQQADYQQALHAIEGPLAQSLKAHRGDTEKMKAIFALAREKAEHGAYETALQALGSLQHLIDAGAQAPPKQEESNYIDSIPGVSAAPQTKPPSGNSPQQGQGDAYYGDESQNPSAEPEYVTGIQQGKGVNEDEDDDDELAATPVPETTFAKWKDRADAFDGWLKRLDANLNGLKSARGSYEKEFAGYQDWMESSARELYEVLKLMEKHTEGKDLNKLDTATQQTVEFLRSLANMATEPAALAELAAKLDAPKPPKKGPIKQAAEQGQARVMKEQAVQLRRVADNDALAVKKLQASIDQDLESLGEGRPLQDAKAAEQAATEALNKARQETGSAYQAWDERREVWDQAGAAAKEAAALVKKLAGENASPELQAAAKQKSADAEGALVAARAASDQAAKLVSQQSQAMRQLEAAYNTAVRDVHSEEARLQGLTSTKELSKAKQKAAESAGQARSLEATIAQASFDKACAMSDSNEPNEIFDQDDCEKLKNFFAKLRLVKPIHERMGQSSAALNLVSGQVKALKTTGLGLKEGIAAQQYSMKLSPFCEFVAHHAKMLADTTHAEQDMGFDPFDLTLIKQARTKLNNEPGGPLNR